MQPATLETAKQIANNLREQIVVLKNASDGKLYAVSAIKWLTADGEVKGMPNYEFVDAIDPEC